MIELKIQFPNEEELQNFAAWLSDGGGEQAFFEGETEIVQFCYHGEEDQTKLSSDPARYGGEWLSDYTIRTICREKEDQ